MIQGDAPAGHIRMAIGRRRRMQNWVTPRCYSYFERQSSNGPLPYPTSRHSSSSISSRCQQPHAICKQFPGSVRLCNVPSPCPSPLPTRCSPLFPATQAAAAAADSMTSALTRLSAQLLLAVLEWHAIGITSMRGMAC